MFGNLSGASPLTFTKVITGISKTLGIVNQAIPIYKEAKPIIQNAKNVYSIFKEFKSTPTNNIENNSSLISKVPIKELNANEVITKSVNQNNNSSLTFFQ